MTILDKIVAHKLKEVEACKERVSISELEKSQQFSIPTYSMYDFIKDEEKSGIIAEFKRRSPSKGDINQNADVKSVVSGYANAGASAISVLTDINFFGGSDEDLMVARKSIQNPILRKDFTISEYQIIEAKSIGADAILLIAAILTKEEIKQFASTAQKLGLEVLLEIHDESELEKYDPSINLVGINNRNLKTFEVDIDHSIALSQQLPSGVIKVAESGISDPNTILHFKKHGFEGFLIGENFMKTPNPGQACKDFIHQINNHAIA